MSFNDLMPEDLLKIAHNGAHIRHSPCLTRLQAVFWDMLKTENWCCFSLLLSLRSYDKAAIDVLLLVLVQTANYIPVLFLSFVFRFLNSPTKPEIHCVEQTFHLGQSNSHYQLKIILVIHTIADCVNELHLAQRFFPLFCPGVNSWLSRLNLGNLKRDRQNFVYH